MTKTIFAIVGAAALVIGTARVASATEHHHRALHQNHERYDALSRDMDFGNANAFDPAAYGVYAPTYGSRLQSLDEGGVISAPAGQ